MDAGIDSSFTETKVELSDKVSEFFLGPEDGAFLFRAASNLEDFVLDLVPAGLVIALGGNPARQVLAVEDGFEFRGGECDGREEQ